jgi:hypothetical protein
VPLRVRKVKKELYGNKEAKQKRYPKNLGARSKFWIRVWGFSQWKSTCLASA